MKLAGPLGFVLSIVTTSTCLAGALDVSPDLRQRAIQTCQNDAVRLCPESLMDEGAAVSCMAGKRPQLSAPCRVVYDQVARVLKE